jgi:hypothetical protein
MVNKGVTKTIKKNQTKRKQLLAQALFESNSNEIGRCDECECHLLEEDLHKHYGSMRKTYFLCPDCDLPPKWHSKWSCSQMKRFYVYFDPATGGKHSITQWSHPTEGNPLHNPTLDSRK